MSKKNVEPLSAHEEGILRATIDEAEANLVPIPVRTVRRLLALIDELRDRLTELQRIQDATDLIERGHLP